VIGFGYAAIAVLAILALERCSSTPNLSSPSAMTSVASATSSSTACARPTDREGRPLYETSRGTFVERVIDAGGAHFIVMRPAEASANQSVLVTPEVYEAVARIERGRAITLFGYVISADSGAHPTYSCIEL
jgi:hypothetical protein